MAFNNSDTTHPPLCAKGCGFFGQPSNQNMCSKCYKDFLKLTTKKIESLAVSEPLNNKSTTLESLSLSFVSPSPADETTSASSTSTKNNRCRCCNKKVGLMGFKCRCGGLFCGSHRYAEEHGCDFDFKTLGRDQLVKENPSCSADKLVERV